MRSAQENLQFQRVEFLGKSFKVGLEFLKNFRLRFGRLGLAELEHHPEVVQPLFRLKQRLNFVAERIGLVNQRLRLFAVVPEIIGGHQGVEFAQAFLRGGHVKETSAGERVSRTLSQFPS
jgi:hypothetical protein